MTDHIDFLTALEAADPVVRDELVRTKQLNSTLATQLMQSESALRNIKATNEWMVKDLHARLQLQSEQLVTGRVNRALLKIALRREREAHNTTRKGQEVCEFCGACRHEHSDVEWQSCLNDMRRDD